MSMHDREKRSRRSNVVAEILKWLSCTFSHSLESSKMNDPSDVPLLQTGFKHPIECRLIAAIHFKQLRSAVEDALQAVQDARMRIGEVVDDYRLISGVDQFNNRMRSNVPRTTCDNNLIQLHAVKVSDGQDGLSAW